MHTSLKTPYWNAAYESCRKISKRNSTGFYNSKNEVLKPVSEVFTLKNE
jgi:hypothetical protein